MTLPDDYSIINDLIEKLQYDLEISENILKQPNASEVNKIWYTRQRDWCYNYIMQFIEIHIKLKSLKMHERVERCIQEETNLRSYDSSIKLLLQKRKEMSKKLAKEKETMRLREEVERKKREEREFVKKNTEVKKN